MEAYITAIEKFCATKQSSQGTLKTYTGNMTRLYKALGDQLTDAAVVLEHIRPLGKSAQQQYAWAVTGVLQGLDRPFEEVAAFEQAAKALSREADSTSERKRKKTASKEKINRLPEYKPLFQGMIEKAQSTIATGTRLITLKSGLVSSRSYTTETLETYQRFIIFCKICLNSTPGRSDLCTVFASKDHADTAGSKNYYEDGVIHYGVRVKDEAGHKPNPPIDVSGAKEEIDAFVAGHKSPYLLGKKYTPGAFASWILAMSSNFCGNPASICLIRKLFVNQSAKKTARKETKKDAREMGHSEATRSKHYDLDDSEDEEDEEEDDTDEAELETQPGKNDAIDVDGLKCQDTDESISVPEPRQKRAKGTPIELPKAPKICIGCWKEEEGCVCEDSDGENDEDSTWDVEGDADSYGPTTRAPCYAPTRPKY